MNIEKIKRLDSPQRAAEYQIERLLELMNINGDEVILDVGAGTGIFSELIAQQLDTGSVKSIDINESLLAMIDNKIKTKGIGNIETIHFDGTIPVAVGSADKVFVCVVLHEIDDKEEFLRMYRDCLKTGGTIYIVEFTSSKRSLGDTSNSDKIFINSNTTESLLAKSGYRDIATVHINELIYLTIGYK